MERTVGLDPPREAELGLSLPALIAEQIAARPDSVAIEDGDRQVTYAELDHASGAIAASLLDTGVEAGEPIAVNLPRSWQAACALVGVLRAGAAYVPLDPAHPPQRRRGLVELSGARSTLEPIDVERAIGAGAAGPEPPAGGDRLAYVLFTSGSTGTPKGVEITDRNLVHLLRSDWDLFPRAGEGCLHVAPLGFDLSAFEIWATLAHGGRIVVFPPGRPDPRKIGALIAGREVGVALVSPGMLTELVRTALPDLAGMRIVATGGDVLPPATAAELRAAHPAVTILNVYGPSETTIVATSHEVADREEGPIPIGSALPGYRLHLLDDEGHVVPEGEPGELWISGPGVGRGYRNDPERTADRFREVPGVPGTAYRTGDRVRRREDGALHFLGRVDHQVKISGQRVEPGESAHALASHPDLREATVVAREDVPGHRHLVGYAVPRPGVAPTPEGLREHVASLLPAYLVPSSVILLEEALPRTDRGKVDVAALPAPARDGGGSAPAGPVAALMAEVLQLDRVDPDESFFALGGSSLLAIQLVGRLREAGIETDISAVFEAPTARALEEHLAAGRTASAPLPPLRPGPRGAVAPVTGAQRRAWIHGRLRPHSITYQSSVAFRFDGDLDAGALRGAIEELIDRHEILRTSFEEREGEPVQVIHERVGVPLETIDSRSERPAALPALMRRLIRTRIDPGEAPLARWTLVRLGERRWYLVQIEHHLIHDGWSSTVLAGELSELYSARVERREHRLQPLQIQFQDFARWERSVAGSESVRRQLAHWKLILDRDPPLLELPTDRPRPPQESFDGGSIRRRIEPPLAARLRQMALEGGATLFMVTLAAFLTQLRAYSGRDDLQIGSGIANRREKASEWMIGMALNTAALRCNLGGDPTVRELLGRIRAVALDAYANVDVPFDAVVEELQPPRDPGRSPLIQTLYSFHDAPRSEERWAGLDAGLVQVLPNGTAKADLNVIGINDRDGGVTFVWEHSDLFTDATADRLAGHHRHLLEQFVARPDARLSELPVAGDAELARIEAWGAGSGEYDRDATVPGLVRRRAELDGGATAILDGEERISYRELLARSLAVAGTLRHRGVERGDRVAVLAPRSAAAVAAFLGILEAGAAYVPLDPDHPETRIDRALRDAGVRVGLVEAGEGRRLPAAIEAIEIGEAVAGAPSDDPIEVDPGDLAYVMYTSGSTGEPKGVEVTHRNIARLVDDPEYVELGPGTVMLHAASPAFDATTLELWGPLANGGAVAILGAQPSPDAVAAAIGHHGVTTLWLTAGLFHELVDARPDCLGSVRHLLAGGDVLSPHHVVRALAALPADGRLTNGYGPTETTTFALTHEMRPGKGFGLGDAVPLGRPIQGTSCAVLDRAGRPAPIGVPGELWIGGDGVARGYRADPELTAQRFVPDPARPGARRYRSGDRVRWRADGTIEFLGRVDRQVKVRGVRVEPAEVESAMLGHPGVSAVAAVPFERAPGDVALAAYVVAGDGSGPPDRSDLRRHAVERLPAAMVPIAWVALPSLPLNANGKVDRDSLPEPGPEHLATTGGAGPETGVERLVVEAFERALGVDGVGVGDDFFALGGHSLLAISLFAELERIAGRRLPLATIFEASTPRGLAARIGADEPADRWDNLVPLKPGGSRPPLFVVSAGDGHLVGFAPLAQHLSAEQPLYGLQPSGLDGRHPLDRGVEEIAERYVARIRELCPRGPYLLAGRCNGATVAYEMGQRLRAAGAEVPLLISLDSDPPPAGPVELEPGLGYDPVMESAMIRAREAGEPVPDPGTNGGAAALAQWLREPVVPGISRYLHEYWHWRRDLRRGWPDPLGRDAAGLVNWAWNHGRHGDLATGLLLPAVTEGCTVPEGPPWDWAMAIAWESCGREPSRPLSMEGWRNFRDHLLEPVGEAGVNRYTLAACQRADLRDAYPSPLDDDAREVVDWSWLHGVREGLAPSLLPEPTGPLPRRLRLELLCRRAGGAARRTGVVAARRAQAAAVEARARVLEEIESRIDRPLPRARPRVERRVVAAAREARASYRAAPWPGRVALITSNEFADKPTYRAWAERAPGRVDRRDLQIGHVEMLRDPGAAILARSIEDAIAEALRDPA
jgi:amino acid adenylation domain-containing protein